MRSDHLPPPHPPPIPLPAVPLSLPHTQVFGRRYFEQMPSMGLRSTDAAYVLAFSVIMLNTDLHNTQVGGGWGGWGMDVGRRSPVGR